MSAEAFIATAYQECLGRAADEEGKIHYLNLLTSNQLTRSGMVAALDAAAVGERARREADLAAVEERERREAVDPDPLVILQTRLAGYTPSMSDDAFVTAAYQVCLGRDPDEDGRHHYAEVLSRDQLSREAVVAELDAAAEGERSRLENSAAFHSGRVVWIRSLPRARRILDLGGTSLDDERGAMVSMGYPYQFDELVIIELPPETRHQLYHTTPTKSVVTGVGPVTYLYRSMTELADLPDGSFDMVCSAQTFEHIQPEEGVQLLKDISRLLSPGGVLALDTPNAAVSSLEAVLMGQAMINPDHKKEYRHSEMLQLFTGAGLRVVRQHGIGYMPKTVRSDQFLAEELLEYPALYDDIECCYTLAYLVTPES